MTPTAIQSDTTATTNVVSRSAVGQQALTTLERCELLEKAQYVLTNVENTLARHSLQLTPRQQADYDELQQTFAKETIHAVRQAYEKYQMLWQHDMALQAPPTSSPREYSLQLTKRQHSLKKAIQPLKRSLHELREKRFDTLARKLRLIDLLTEIKTDLHASTNSDIIILQQDVANMVAALHQGLLQDQTYYLNQASYLLSLWRKQANQPEVRERCLSKLELLLNSLYFDFRQNLTDPALRAALDDDYAAMINRWMFELQQARQALQPYRHLLPRNRLQRYLNTVTQFFNKEYQQFKQTERDLRAVESQLLSKLTHFPDILHQRCKQIALQLASLS